jgi:hypothetical protein
VTLRSGGAEAALNFALGSQNCPEYTTSAVRLVVVAVVVMVVVATVAGSFQLAHQKEACKKASFLLVLI